MQTQNGSPLILVRHGQALHHIQEITGGWTDTDLTEEGKRHAKLLSARLRVDLAETPLYLGSSNLLRALRTAQIIGRYLGIEPQVLPPLTDLNNGIAAGKTHEEARKHAIPPSEPIIDWQPYPEAESWRQFHTRVSRFMDEFWERQTQTTILVTHSATIHVILAWWLELPIESRTHFDVAPASLSVLRVTPWGERAIERLNDTAHLYAHGAGPRLGI